MHGSMSWKSLQTLGKVNQAVDIFLFLIGFPEFRIHSQGLINGDIWLLWNHLGDGVYLGIRHVQNTAYITDHTAGCQSTKGNNLNHAIIAIFPPYIIDNFLSSFEAEVHINIRHGHSFRIQETLKEKIIPDRVQLGDSKGISNQTSCGRTSSRADHDIIVSGIFDEVPHNEEVIYISHVFDGGQLIIQAFFQRIGYRMITLFQPFMAKLVQILPGGQSVGHIIFRQLGHAEFDLHVAAQRDLVGIFQSFQSIWKKSRHLFWRFHIILAALIAHSVLIAEFFLGLQTEEHVMGLRILSHGIMHVIGSNQVDSCLSVHAEKLLVYRLLLRNSMILKLQEEISFSKNILITQGCDLCILIHSTGKIPCDLSCQAGT